MKGITFLCVTSFGSRVWLPFDLYLHVNISRAAHDFSVLTSSSFFHARGHVFQTFQVAISQVQQQQQARNKWRTGLDDLAAIISQHLKHIRFHHEGMPLIKEINGVGSNIRTLTTFAATNA